MLIVKTWCYLNGYFQVHANAEAREDLGIGERYIAGRLGIQTQGIALTSN